MSRKYVADEWKAVRRIRLEDRIQLDDPIPVAASRNFETRTSIAYDAGKRLWIAYELSGEKWGKDFGQYQTTGAKK